MNDEHDSLIYTVPLCMDLLEAAATDVCNLCFYSSMLANIARVLLDNNVSKEEVLGIIESVVASKEAGEHDVWPNEETIH